VARLLHQANNSECYPTETAPLAVHLPEWQPPSFPFRAARVPGGLRSAQGLRSRGYPASA